MSATVSTRRPMNLLLASSAISAVVTLSRPWASPIKCSVRSATHFTGRLRRFAATAANVAAVISRQSFLVDEDAAWVVRERDVLQRIWRRASIVLSIVSTATGEHQLGIQHAAEACAAEPFDEVACQALMRAHAVAGNRAEALRVFARCRRLFREELGADPSQQTIDAFMAIFRSKS